MVSGFQKRLMSVLWPAFLSAAMIEMLVFALVDPQDLHWAGQRLMLSREAIYTVAFFSFWAIGIVSNGLTALLAMTPEEVNGERGV